MGVLSEPPLLVISGLSGCGKTTYLEWLAGRGWTALNHDLIAGHGFVSNDLERAWASTFEQAGAPTVEPFLKRAAEWPQPIALEFGFPMPLLPMVVGLRDAGASIWWFDGDRPAAKQAWRERNATRAEPYPDAAWRIYVDSVDLNWPSICEVFGSHIIRVIGPGKWHLPPQQIDRLILGTA